jgi:hypothetical protein
MLIGLGRVGCRAGIGRELPPILTATRLEPIAIEAAMAAWKKTQWALQPVTERDPAFLRVEERLVANLHAVCTNMWGYAMCVQRAI